MLKGIISYLNSFFFTYMIVYSILFFVISVISAVSISEYIRKRKFKKSLSFDENDNYIPVSILVPAYNEEVTIIDSLKSLMGLDYPEYEIVIINDGSKDKTAELVIKEFNLRRVESPIRDLVPCKKMKSIYENTVNGVRMKLINKENGGKADSLNMGINTCKYPLFISLDADSVLQKDALLKIVEPFIEDNKTVAVGGSIKVANSTKIEKGQVISERIPRKLMIIFQMVEYIRVFTATRVAFDKINANLIVSGAFGMFNKKKVVAIGGYNTSTMGEDMELVVRLHEYSIKNEIPYKVAYVIDSVCLSQVPETYSDLRKQRRRWHTGMLQSLTINKEIFKNIKNPFLKVAGYIYYLLFEMLAPLIEIVGLITVIVGYALNAVSVSSLILYFLVFIVYNIVITWLAISLNNYISDRKSSVKMRTALYLASVLESFGFRQLNSFYRIESILKFKSKKQSWGRIERKTMK